MKPGHDRSPRDVKVVSDLLVGEPIGAKVEHPAIKTSLEAFSRFGPFLRGWQAIPIIWSDSIHGNQCLPTLRIKLKPHSLAPPPDLGMPNWHRREESTDGDLLGDVFRDSLADQVGSDCHGLLILVPTQCSQGSLPLAHYGPSRIASRCC